MDESENHPNPSFIAPPYTFSPSKPDEVAKEDHLAAIRYHIDQLLKVSDEHSAAYRAMHEILPHLDAIEGKTDEPKGKSVMW